MKSVLLLAGLILAALVHGADLVVYRVANLSLKDRYEAKCSYPVFDSQSPMAKLANNQIRKWATEQQVAFIKECKVFFKDGANGQERPWTQTIDTKNVFQTAKAISVRMRADVYTGGVHPVYDDFVFNYALINGKAKKMALADLFANASACKQRVAKLLMNTLRTKYKASYVCGGMVKALEPEQLNRFVIGPKSLTFVFNLYEVGCYAEGNFEVPLSFTDLGPSFKKAALGLK